MCSTSNCAIAADRSGRLPFPEYRIIVAGRDDRQDAGLACVFERGPHQRLIGGRGGIRRTAQTEIDQMATIFTRLVDRFRDVEV